VLVLEVVVHNKDTVVGVVLVVLIVVQELVLQIALILLEDLFLETQKVDLIG